MSSYATLGKHNLVLFNFNEEEQFYVVGLLLYNTFI